MSATGELRCTTCGEPTPPGRFCIHCGASTARTCPACGESVVAGARFCGACGTAQPSASAVPSAADSPGSVSERRLVSVLFADLVGFTTLSEHRDPEEVRELLSRYFDRCRMLIERYGGTVEKFIGDAVMAVWGTPVAREDDAERAVRAALSLTGAVTLLGEEVGMPALRVRAGVLTGNAAVDLGAEGEGMVLGDTVNTASRLQSIAAPGTVLVDDVTRRASEAAVEYEDAGEHQVKGREQPVRAWTALRVVAGVGGARRSVGLEAPFVGRARELQTLIESAEQSAALGRARLVTVVGDAGIGKSRLLWEYFKYVDGVESVVRWHQGRCLSYGEGVAYWALAEIVRARAGILEEEDPVSARAKLRETVEQFVTDERERRLIEPRLAHLLGLEQRTASDRADLFSGWRLFFERIADDAPVVLVFEDLQWADSGLLDFIDYLLEWSAEHPIFILALGRPELRAARPEWTPTIALEPLPNDAVAALLDGLIPGLPQTLSEQIGSRAEGVPLYAVETVRMLVDRGLVAQQGTRYVVTGEIADLDVPETLLALVAARLDNLDQRQRALLQDAAVIGRSFTPATLSAVSGLAETEVRRVLDGLVARQVLAHIDDARSADYGQYAFLQALLRTVALSTLSRRDRKAKHLAVAHQLEQSAGEEPVDVAEVLASHYLEAVAADPDADDADAIRASACRTLEEAGNRARSLALAPEARRHYERAAELTRDPAHRGRLLRQAAVALFRAGQLREAVAVGQAAAAALEGTGLIGELARAHTLLAEVLIENGSAEEAIGLLTSAHDALGDGSDDEALAEVAACWARAAFSIGDGERALTLADTALRVAEGRRLTSVLVNALTTKGNVLSAHGRPAESTALLTHALALATDQDLGAEAVRPLFNLAENLLVEARFVDAEELLERGLAQCHRRGDRQSERWLLCQSLLPQVLLGRWDEAVATAETILAANHDDIWAWGARTMMPFVLAARGDLAGLEELALDDMRSDRAEAAATARTGLALIASLQGDPGSALADARASALSALENSTSLAPTTFAEAIETAFAAGRPDVAGELLTLVDGLSPVQRLPLLDAEANRAHGRLAAAQGDGTEARLRLRRAIDLFRELGTPFGLAQAQLELAELLHADGAGPEEWAALHAEAAATFEALRATPWLERVGSLQDALPAALAR